MPRVLDGLFSLCNRLFGITVKEAEEAVSVWNEDVKFYNVYGENGDHIASFYLDPYSRPAEKRGGAWMDECLGRSRLFAAPGATVAAADRAPGVQRHAAGRRRRPR
jgi:oligopeptidase A